MIKYPGWQIILGGIVLIFETEVKIYFDGDKNICAYLFPWVSGVFMNGMIQLASCLEFNILEKKSLGVFFF